MPNRADTRRHMAAHHSANGTMQYVSCYFTYHSADGVSNMQAAEGRYFIYHSADGVSNMQAAVGRHFTFHSADGAVC